MALHRRTSLLPYTTLFRSSPGMAAADAAAIIELLLAGGVAVERGAALLAAWSARGETGEELAAVARALLARAVRLPMEDRKSTRLNSSHLVISYAVFCLIK